VAQDDGQERTEEATPKRQREAKEKGQIARSRELTTLVMLLIAGAAMMVMGDQMVSSILTAMESGFQVQRTEIFDPFYPVRAFQRLVTEVFISLSPFFIVTIIVALLAPAAIGGWSFSAQAIAFKWDKLDPIKGLKRVLGPQGFMELFKALAKFSLIFVATVLALWAMVDEFLGLGNEPIEQGLAHAGHLVLWVFILASSALFVVAAIDVPFQIWNHNKQLRMTRQEVKDEFKDTEGKPEVKRRVREVQMEMSRRRMMAEVPKADVIVTNPTHYSVALKYDQSEMEAPMVIAKGADLIALEIRRVARDANVPIMESPALARSIFHTTELNEEIPAGLYKAVAMILAHVFQLRKKRRYTSRPISMPNVPIPDELKRD
jgi:flagellar biosynthetic protein FlhB